MAHQKSFRSGWQNENLARFILYKFAFVSQPATIADDIGIDFICTFFNEIKNPRNYSLIPNSSFSLQVKSNENIIDAKNILPTLNIMEMPFLVSVADNNDLSLTFYSGEYLPALFTFKGIPENLKIELCTRGSFDKINGWFSEGVNGEVILKFPLITKINAKDENKILEEKVIILREVCNIIRGNVYSRFNDEFIFKTYQSDFLMMFAGPYSYQNYKINFYARLAEAFTNLSWAFQNTQFRNEAKNDFLIFESFYKHLLENDIEVPSYLRATYNDASKLRWKI